MFDLGIANGALDITPEKELAAIAASGFTHIHWCHQWSGDYLYSRSEMEFFAGCLRENSLRIQDLHASCGKEKCLFSSDEYRRKAGVELLLNRAEFLAESVVERAALVLHIPNVNDIFNESAFQTPILESCGYLRRSLDELSVILPKYGDYRIAVENMPYDNFSIIRTLLADYPPEFLGLAFDSGHANMSYADGFSHAESLKERIIALHLHDNDGSFDQHRIPFSGTIDHEKLAKLIATSAFRGALTLETAMRYEPEYADNNGKSFLQRAFEAGQKLAAMVEKFRAESPSAASI